MKGKAVFYGNENVRDLGRKLHRDKKWAAFCLIVILVSLMGCKAFAAGLSHTLAARVFLSYANDITDWEEYYYTGKHPDDGDGVTLTGYVDGHKMVFSAHSYYYGLAGISLKGTFQDLKTNGGQEYVFTDANLVYLYFLWTIDNLGIIAPPEYGDLASSNLWGPYGIYEKIKQGELSGSYSKSEWPDVEITKGEMTAVHANGAYFMFYVLDDGTFTFYVSLP